jgi:hypothetical protein
VAARGGVEAVVAAMNAHRQSANVLKQGCRALASISVLTENMVRVVFFFKHESF